MGQIRVSPKSIAGILTGRERFGDLETHKEKVAM